jgi:hypothetical protein
MSEENCKTCHEHKTWGCGGKGDFQENSKKSCYKPDYQTLESRLKVAVELLAESKKHLINMIMTYGDEPCGEAVDASYFVATKLNLVENK